ncbi:siderophore ABC transporter substrate-binding protein [Virgibacillus sp. AGTR]|uniref:Siderophore ABC transporter substrate-binding protein n=1 Tax=Virgibacillus salarius TaxID=447199 RepID=A0A941IDD4_9BACI|nr:MULTISPECIES: siderophore ABC transporter substrate-binding protein [Virgibacillus]NAZ10995.1 ABC transporter substrate-binding protein [Agaribacter marinus]MBR7798287.1 siderophore ABC transporter substrate-binding protein [Virgibacillus salarius]MCC2250638.1 siderophore ABC transporter substrate-binding protein [Virgibacillus sp. AGTR]MDY7046015.1 siderophore ABC transporter substrate-binding protein [Virgibacillus sp. M23]QRZ19572.1 siderophore ABC transporter substrate-binding protein [
MKKLLLLLFMSIMVFALAACGSDEEKSSDEGNSGSKEKETAETENIKITQELGDTEVPQNPEKVVVFDYGVLDSLDKLGVEVAGVAKGNIPSYLEKYEGEEYENIGSLKEPDFEKIAEIDPDVIFISGRQSSVYDQLSELAPTVYLGVDTTRYMESFKENMSTLGKIFDKQSEVEEELATIDESIAGIQEKAKQADENALIILANDDKISAYGPSSRFGIIHDVFNVPAVDKDIEASTHGQNVSFEYVVEKNPDLLYVIDRSAAIGEESSAKQIVENELVQGTKAYENDNIVYLDPEFWYLSGGGLVSVQGMVDEIQASLEK